MQFQPQRVTQLRVTADGVEYSFHEDNDGGIVATVVRYPSCQGYGQSLDEAMDAVQEALLATLEEIESLGHPIPGDLQQFMQAHRTQEG